MIGVFLLLSFMILFSFLTSFDSRVRWFDHPVFQMGMSYATYANIDSEVYGSFKSNKSLERLRDLGVEWVALNVVHFQFNESSFDIYPINGKSPTREAVAKAVEKCHTLGMRVMLKPMVDLENGSVKPCWRGNIRPSERWFRSYESFIFSWAEFAEVHKVEMLCIGCEYMNTVDHTVAWVSIVRGVRARYSGMLIYASTWDECHKIGWWSELDYVGINAYFPLTSKSDPTLDELTEAWKPYVERMESLATRLKKPIVFTEIGYLSCNGTNTQPWNYTMQWDGNLGVDLQEQAECYEAALRSLWGKPWFYGFYWWYWQTDPDAGGPNDKDYTPQNKPAEEVLRRWYQR